MSKILNSIIVAFVCICTCAFAEQYNPSPNPQSVVLADNVRFTVLNPRVIRMEWSEKNQFEDHSTLVFVNRFLPAPDYSKSVEDGWMTIQTESLRLRYKLGSGRFTADNLNVDMNCNGMEKSWEFGQENPGNLKGTIRTLDGTDGGYSFYRKQDIELEPGLISRDGWVVIDDTARPIFDNTDWSWVMARPEGEHQDLYFFAYGYDYKAVLSDYTKIAGKIALPPKFAFGYWYSRWRSFSDMEFQELVDTFEKFKIPLDVLVVDMDWHLAAEPEFFTDGKRNKDQAGENCGWTGFTWNKDFFPDPAAFLKWTDDKGLKTCLNLHPASGFQPHEEKYEYMAKVMGIDPATKKYVPFTITDKKFAKNYFESVLHPMEKDGVDFWWLDWQQWNTTDIPGVNPTFYLNYVHYTDMERENKVRPLIYHRWGGLGNHRYQIGFSGDTKITWASLDYQPYFTSTASNVGFGYWSNDIGGFYSGLESDELFVRWFQYGIFSPITKTHATGNFRTIKRRIWQYPYETFTHLQELIQLRHSLVPYIYTASREAYDTGISICRPMYYDYPKSEEAYEFKNEYMFGDDLLINPITTQMEEGKLFATQSTWLPEGDWFELCSGTMLQGGQTVERDFTITELPVYAKAGSIIPMQEVMNRVVDNPADPLVLKLVPGERGTTTLYEDEGDNNNFKAGDFTNTTISAFHQGWYSRVVIDPVKGKFEGMLKKRAYKLQFLNTLPPKTVRVNGKELKFSNDKAKGSWYYDAKELSTVVYTDSYNTNKTKEIELVFPKPAPELLDGKKGQMARMYEFSKFLTDNRYSWNDGYYSRNVVLKTAQAPLIISRDIDSAVETLTQFEAGFAKTAEMLEAVSKDKDIFKPYSELMNR